MGIKTILTCDHPDCTNEQGFDGPYHIAKNKIREGGWVNHKHNDKWLIKCQDHNPYQRRIK